MAGGVNCSSDKTFDDLNRHGTHVAGIMGALNNSIGVVGVAPGARLWAVRVCNKNGSCSMSSVLCGIDWATSTRSDSDLRLSDSSRLVLAGDSPCASPREIVYDR